MKMSIDGLVMLAGNEGIVVNRYFDSVGVATIGVGHTAAAGGLDPRSFAGTMTVKQAIDLFQVDIAKYERGVMAAVTAPMTQTQFDAFAHFHYNTGAIGRASFVKDFNAGAAPSVVAEGMMAWKIPPSIIPRRGRERDLFLTGKYSGLGMATVYTADSSGRVLWNKGRQVDVKSLLVAPQMDVPAPAPVASQPRSLWDRLRGVFS